MKHTVDSDHPRSRMINFDNRILVYCNDESGDWVAQSVDYFSGCIGEDLIDLKDNFQSSHTFYFNNILNMSDSRYMEECEPWVWPIFPDEYLSVFENGEEIEFVDGFIARKVDYKKFSEAHNKYITRSGEKSRII